MQLPGASRFSKRRDDATGPVKVMGRISHDESARAMHVYPGSKADSLENCLISLRIIPSEGTEHGRKRIERGGLDPGRSD